MRFRWLWPWAALSLCAVPVHGQEKAPRVLTLDEAMALARERGRNVILAKGRVEEAKARQAQAGRRFQEDPVLELIGGYRRAGEDFLDFDAAVTQGLYAGRRRSARLAGAQAGLDRSEAELAEARRLLSREVWATFARLLVAQDRIALLAKNTRSADALLAAARRRDEAGEGTALELNRARVSAVNARVVQSAAEAMGSAARADLQALLGLDEPVEIRGDLSLHPPPSLETLLAGIGRRPDLRALAAEVREAEAEILLGQALTRPDLGLRGGVAREERADIVRAGIVLTLPVHAPGQETLAVGQARATALRQALAVAAAAADTEVRGKHAVLIRQLAAVRELEQTALPALDDNEALAGKSFEAGEIGLGELLLVRREIVETRLAYLDALLDAALTRFELETAAGVLP
jgi:cobalt-zinc-cadmium efflux system outer membrane protein